MDTKGLIDEKRGLVNRRIFSDPAIYDEELEQIFARCWLFLGHESQIANPGDFLTTWMGEDPVIVTRTRDGQVHAFINSCRHRGNRVCRVDEGNAASFMCSYHGWTYANDGTLIGVPGHKEVYHGELDRSEWGLIQVAQIASYKGLIFATFDPTAPPLEEYMGVEIRWALDTLVDAQEGGATTMGSVNKWIMHCNWKFPSDNIVGDNYHGNITHLSAAKAGHSTENRNKEDRAIDAWGRKGLTMSTEYGHGFNVALRNEADRSPTASPSLAAYYEETASVMEQRLGKLRARDIIRYNLTILPNFSVNSSSGTIHVWHPKGPEKIEVWQYTLMDQAAPPEAKNAFRLSSLHHFGPGGLFEQDDGENWEQSTLGTRGAVARRYPFHYAMGMGHEEWVPADADAPGRLNELVTEHTQRNFYRAWAELMTGASWDELAARSSNGVHRDGR